MKDAKPESTSRSRVIAQTEAIKDKILAAIRGQAAAPLTMEEMSLVLVMMATAVAVNETGSTVAIEKLTDAMIENWIRQMRGEGAQ